jgi:lipopolysaccharide transport system ATP-binding protein
MPTSVVAAEKLSKSYPVFRSPLDRLASLVDSRRRAERRFRALSDISFALAPGESLGLLGENGAGKSTLLKLVAGVTQPTSGRISVNGRVAAILELGSGFHPDFTGRQNIELNAAMLGLEPDEVRNRMPAIIEFAEIGDFIDRPVRQYSSGMAMRLAFSIAIQVDPDILIVDEALSVGDGYFQKKCKDRISAFRDSGKTLLFCSHALYYISAFCDNAIWLRNGRVEAVGETKDVVQQYETYLLKREAKLDRVEAESAPESKAAPQTTRLLRVELVGGTMRNSTRTYAPLEPWTVEFEWETEDPERRFHLGVGIDLESGLTVAAFSSRQDGSGPFSGATHYRARFEIPRLPLVKGIYRSIVFLGDDKALHVYDRRWLDEAFAVSADEFSLGLIYADHEWRVGGTR